MNNNELTLSIEQLNKPITLTNQFFDNPRALVAQQTTEQKAMTFALAEYFKEAADEAKKGLFTLKELEKIAIPLPNGDTMVLTLSHGKETPAKATKQINIQKALAFAKEHNFNVPMTPRQIIEPVVDTEALQNEEWFQANADQFSEWVEGKPVKSYDRMLKKIVKGDR